MTEGKLVRYFDRYLIRESGAGSPNAAATSTAPCQTKELRP